MEIHLEDAKLMKSIIDPMIPVGEDIYLEISTDGLRAHCLGIGGAWAADAVLNRSNFSDIDVDGTSTYYVKLKDFADFMKTVQSNDDLTIRENSDKGTLELILKSDQMTKKIAIRIQSLSEEFKIKQFMRAEGAAKAKAELQTDLFAQAVKAAELGGEEVTFTTNALGLKLEATDTNKSAEAHISYKNNENVKNIELAEEDTDYQSIFKLEYLRHISRVGKSGDNISVWLLDTNGPLILAYFFQKDADEAQVGYLGFAIAPRVQREDF